VRWVLWPPRRPRRVCATTCGYQASSAPPACRAWCGPPPAAPAARGQRHVRASRGGAGGAQVVPLVLPELEELQGAADEAARLRRMFELVWAHGGLEAPPGARRRPAPRASGACRGLRWKCAAQEARRSRSRRTRAAPRGTKSSRDTLHTVGPGGLCDGDGAQGRGRVGDAWDGMPAESPLTGAANKAWGIAALANEAWGIAALANAAWTIAARAIAALATAAWAIARRAPTPGGLRGPAFSREASP